MVSRRILTLLVAVAFLLPVAILVVLAVGRVLSAMQDAAAASVLDRLALAAGILWVIDLVCLLMAVGINALVPPPEE